MKEASVRNNPDFTCEAFTCKFDFSIQVVNLWSQTKSVQVQAAKRQVSAGERR